MRGVDQQHRHEGRVQLERDLAAARNDADQLRIALVNSRRIGMAMGLVMARYRVDADQAFALLTRLSQTENRKLVAIAGDVIAAHRLAGDDFPGPS